MQKIQSITARNGCENVYFKTYNNCKTLLFFAGSSSGLILELHDSELNKIMCDKILIAAVYLKVFNLNELLNMLIYNTVRPGFTDGA